jgi:hypothetical protein
MVVAIGCRHSATSETADEDYENNYDENGIGAEDHDAAGDPTPLSFAGQAGRGPKDKRPRVAPGPFAFGKESSRDDYISK